MKTCLKILLVTVITICIAYIIVRTTRPKFFLSALVIAKNEEMVMREFLEHYRSQGFDHVYLIDNGSTDNTVKNATEFGKDFVTIYKRPDKHAQVRLYNQVYSKHKNDTEWLAIIDADEYLFGVQKPLRKYLETCVTCSYFSLPWIMYGSVGEKHPESIRQACTKRFPDNFSTEWSNYRKVVFRTKVVPVVDLHDHETVAPKTLCAVNDPNIRLNHYPLASLEYFQKIKMTRGDAANPKTDTVRDMNYYHKYNTPATQEDRTLAKIAQYGYDTPNSREQVLDFFQAINPLDHGYNDRETMENVLEYAFAMHEPQLKDMFYKLSQPVVLVDANELSADLDIVIAYYSVPLNWLSSLLTQTKSYTKCRIFIYTKNRNDMNKNLDFPIHKIVRLQNIGRCDHTYLFHIIDNYSKPLSKKTFFVKDSVLARKVTTLNWIRNNIFQPNHFFIGPFIVNNADWEKIKIEQLSTFALENYEKSWDQRKNEDVFFKAPLFLSTFRKWYEAVFEKPFDTKDIQKRALAGVFAFSSSNIHKLSLLEWLKLGISVSYGRNVATGHFMERLWYHVLN